jgi:hypothetical protein
MAEDGAGAAREYGGEEAAMHRQTVVAHGIDPPVDKVELAASHANGNCGATETHSQELQDRDDSVLRGCEPGYRDIDSCGVVVRVTLTNPPRAAHADNVPPPTSQDYTRP